MPPSQSPPSSSASDAAVQRALKITIAVMGIMIVAGLLAIVARIGYLATREKPGTSALAPSGHLATAAQLALPQGAAVRSLSLSGDRLAVHYTSPGGDGIAILDLVSGATVSQVTISDDPGAPAP